MTGSWASPFILTSTRTWTRLSKTLLDQLKAFFISYNKQRGKKFKVTATGSLKKRYQVFEAGIKAHKKVGKKYQA